MNRQEREFRDAWYAAHDLTKRDLADGLGMTGFGVAHLMDGDGKTKLLAIFRNLITTAGDQYYAQKGIVGIGPISPTAPTAMNGMKLGTGSTAPAKSGTNAAIMGTYVTGSNAPFDAGYAQASAVAGTDTGWYMTYKTTWAAGTATNTTINEVVTVNDAGTNATTSAANTYSRATITTVNKTATDILAITWAHKALGT